MKGRATSEVWSIHTTQQCLTDTYTNIETNKWIVMVGNPFLTDTRRVPFMIQVHCNQTMSMVNKILLLLQIW